MLQKVTRSTVIDAPLERVWAALRDFNSHDQWHAVVDESRIEAGDSSDRVGCVRNFTLKDGNHIREQLLALDDRLYKSTYTIVEATVPLMRYVASVTLKRVTDGNRTFWHWESSFATPPGREVELREMVAQGVYEAGFESLRRHLTAGGDLQPRRGGTATAEGTATRSGAMPRALPVPTRRVRLERYGGSDGLVPVDTECPAPAPGQVRIRQRAIGVNFFDVYLRKGWMPQLLAEGGTPGMEAAGTVLDVGEGVADLLPGDRVAYLHHEPGAYCGLRCVPADAVVRLPAAIDDHVAAALLLKGLTADLLLHDVARIGRGTRLLVHAAAGGVGLLLCQWARSLGAAVVGTVSNETKARAAREHGCEHAIVAPDYRFAAAVQQLVGGADVLIDGLGDAAREENIAALARRGHWVSLGQATGGLQPIDPNVLVAKSISFSRPVVFDYVATRAELRQRAERLWRAVEQGAVRVPPIEHHSLESAAHAHERLESRATIGAVVLLA